MSVSGGLSKSLKTMPSSSGVGNSAMVPPDAQNEHCSALLPKGPWVLQKEGKAHPLPHLQLAGWLVSGNDMLQQEFQNRLETCLFLPGASRPQNHSSQLGTYGAAGVINNKLIPFQQP